MLNDQISRYVALHRNLGRKFEEQDRILQLFANYAQAFGDQHVNVSQLYDWCGTATTQNAARTEIRCGSSFQSIRSFRRSKAPGSA